MSPTAEISGIERWFCCYNHEEVNGTCIECLDGFQSLDGSACRPCPGEFFGRDCRNICNCNINEICDHVQGCLTILPSTEAATEHGHVEVKIYICAGSTLSALGTTDEIKSKIGYAHIIGTICTYLIILLLVSIVFVSLTCICWKYEVSCKKRERSIFHTNSTHPNESRNNPPQVETHQYDEVDDVFLNRVSSINDEQDVRSSESSNEGSGICGIDSDGYLNPYNALKSIEISLDQTSSCDQLTTETSFIHTQENTIYFTDQMQN